MFAALTTQPDRIDEGIVLRLVLVALGVLLINLPFGFWRSGLRRFGAAWLVAVHAPVLLAVGLRLLSGLRWHPTSLLVLAAAFFTGQFCGGKLGQWHRRRTGSGERRPGSPSLPAEVDYGLFADVYDACARFDEDIPFFLAEAAAARGPVLELMCGTGRVTLPLLRAGADLTCVDLCPEMLAVLREKLEGEGLHADLRLADVRGLRLDKRFELALLPFQALSELVTAGDRMAALGSIRDCLSPGGRVLCTLHNPVVRLRRIDGTPRVEVRAPWKSGGEILMGARMTFDPETRIASGEQWMEKRGANGELLERRSGPACFALPGREEFEALASASGFRVVELFGDYSRGPFSPDESPYMIWRIERL